jgi:hypothetical protein
MARHERKIANGGSRALATIALFACLAIGLFASARAMWGGSWLFAHEDRAPQPLESQLQVHPRGTWQSSLIGLGPWCSTSPEAVEAPEPYVDGPGADTRLENDGSPPPDEVPQADSRQSSETSEEEQSDDAAWEYAAPVTWHLLQHPFGGAKAPCGPAACREPRSVHIELPTPPPRA